MLAAAVLMLAAPQVAGPPSIEEATVVQPVKAADGTERWSILADSCGEIRSRQDEIRVCGRAADSPTLPLPEERGPPDRPMPSNPDKSGMGALAVTPTPCAARIGGCTVGVDLFGAGTALIRGVGKLIDPNSCCEEPGEATNPMGLIKDVGSAVGHVFRKKPDKSNRVPIVLDDLPDPDKAERPAAAAATTP